MNVQVPEIPAILKDIKINESLIHEVVTAELGNLRSATANVKTRSEVSGGGRKPWRQKGTGRARVGSSRSPLWRGGGITFGPTKDKIYKKRVPKKKRQQATLQMIVSKINQKNLKIVDEIKLDEPKTRFAVKFLQEIFNISTGNKVLILLEKKTEEIFRSFRNIKNVTITDYKSLNALKLIKYENILFSKGAWDGFLTQKSLNEPQNSRELQSE